jgi:hypothetical protein
MVEMFVVKVIGRDFVHASERDGHVCAQTSSLLVMLRVFALKGWSCARAALHLALLEALACSSFEWVGGVGA